MKELTNEELLINFAYFTANFPNDFIQKCWKGDDFMIKVVTGKFMNYCAGKFMSCGDFIHFFFDLDRKNQTKLSNWINENYRGI